MERSFSVSDKKRTRPSGQAEESDQTSTVLIITSIKFRMTNYFLIDEPVLHRLSVPHTSEGPMIEYRKDYHYYETCRAFPQIHSQDTTSMLFESTFRWKISRVSEDTKNTPCVKES